MTAATESHRPVCFVIMPFGQKPNPAGGVVDFDAVYEQLVRPAVTEAGMTAIRADEERSGGLIHKAMFERIVLAEFAVADLTTANANVFYEVGVRHGIRPYSTVLIFASGAQLPFDLGPVRAIQYGATPSTDVSALTQALMDARAEMTDSPLFQLLDGLDPPDVSRLKTDVFRERVQYDADVKQRLATARRGDVAAVEAVRAGLGALADQETGVLIDLLLSYRAVGAWEQMIDLVDELPESIAGTRLVREQLGFALNRAGRGADAEMVLEDLIADRGGSSETYGILGRVYKDRWEHALDNKRAHLATGLLDKAISAYLTGFEADWRDAYPGINAVTLMELRDPPDERRHELLGVVLYAVQRRLADAVPDYWDNATLLELAVLRRREDEARTALGAALAAVREPWEPETTRRNLRLIREARQRRDEHPEWATELEEAMSEAPDEP